MLKIANHLRLSIGKSVFRMEQRDLLTNVEQFTKDELVEQIHRLQTHVQQLRNVIAKQDKPNEKKDHGKQRKFDFTKYKKRHVALKILYLGWNYQGFVVQEDTSKTIEANIFEALLTTRLIESRQSSNYHRCGRTDKGVSALSQVISLDLRTNLLEGEGVVDYDGCTAAERIGNTTVEIDYPLLLNRLLPSDIKVIAWSPVLQSFSARFDCSSRTYKYFFPRGTLNIEAMNQALEYLIGTHDFRNFCKHDATSMTANFTRSISFAEICCLFSADNINVPGKDEYDMFELTIRGKAFLWHQIRCIAAVLFFIGKEKEQPEIIKELLDIEKNPLRPDYSLASDLPLMFYDCEFEDVNWIYNKEATERLLNTFQRLWSSATIQATVISAALTEIHKITESQDIKSICSQTSAVAVGATSKNHKPLMERQKCKSVEEKSVKYAMKRKFKDNDSDNLQS